jgi:acylphosphatase
VTIRFRVTGRVQGVSYRAWTCHTAAGLGLVGWVRNLTDGSVEGCASGAAPALDALVQALHRGPPHARVEAVTVVPADDAPFPDFSPRPTVDP